MGTNVRFFGENFINEDSTLTLTSADTTITANLYDRFRSTALYSYGSDDITDEVWEIEFDFARDFNRIIVDNHNIKSGNIKYWNGSAYVNFSTPIAWAANAATTSFFEFASVNSTKIKLTLSTTISANAEKSIAELLVCQEIGEVSVNPESVKTQFIDKRVLSTNSDGGTEITLFGHERSKIKMVLKFDQATAADMTIFRTLKFGGTPFFVYLCGGVTTYTEDGWRPQDFYLVTWANDFTPEMKSFNLGIGTKLDMELREA